MNLESVDAVRARDLIARFAGLPVLVVGDAMLDRFIVGHVTRISPEAPVPVVALERREYRIGGAGNVSLEELILSHAVGRTPPYERESRAGGVMMIPIPTEGILRAVEGLDEARAVQGIEDIEITLPLKHTLVPLPEGNSYLGFIFARGETADAVELALRRSHAELRFHIATALETFSPST